MHINKEEEWVWLRANRERERSRLARVNAFSLSLSPSFSRHLSRSFLSLLSLFLAEVAIPLLAARLMARDPRLSYDADSSLVNDYDNSGSELARRWHSPRSRDRERPFDHDEPHLRTANTIFIYLYICKYKNMYTCIELSMPDQIGRSVTPVDFDFLHCFFPSLFTFHQTCESCGNLFETLANRW